MAPSAHSVSRSARGAWLIGLAFLVTCVASVGIVPTAGAASHKGSGKATASSAHKKRQVVRGKKPAKKVVAGRKAKTPSPGAVAPTSTTPAPTAAASPAAVPTSSTSPWTPIAGGGSENGTPGTGASGEPTAPPTGTNPGTPPVETTPGTPPVETTPVTPTNPSVPAGRLFTGAKISDFALNQSAPGAVTEVPSPTGGENALQMTVSNSDVYPVTPTENPRAQLLSPNLFKSGDEFWWHSKFFLPANFPSVPGWMAVLEGPYGAPFAGPPPFSIQLHGETMGWQRNSTYGYDVPWEAPIARNQWTDVLVHCRFGTSGFVELWINGEQITFFSRSPYNPRHETAKTRLDMATEDASNNGGTNFAVIQSYRQNGILSSVSLLQGPMMIGSTRASVE